MSSLATGALLAIIGAALATWVVGVRLAGSTDELDDNFANPEVDHAVRGMRGLGLVRRVRIGTQSTVRRNRARV